MDTNDEQQETRWHDELARLGEQIKTLKVQMESRLLVLRDEFDTHIVGLEADVRRLEALLTTPARDPEVNRIEAQIDRLRAQGDAAYDLLQATLPRGLDPIDASIRRLEAAAAALPSGEDRRRILTRIEQIRQQQAAPPSQPPNGSDALSPQG